jgi:hypothetical protein
MKLLAQTQFTFRPMLLGRASKAFPGGDLMPQLRLCPVVLDDDHDTIPFPRTVSRIGRWQPRLASDGRHEAELALDQANAHLGRLAHLLDSDDDRPRAA